MFELLALYVAVINTATFATFAFDKQAAARRSRRVPERQLLLLAAVGGSPAALLAQRVLRHKTRKEPFRTVLWTILAAQAAALASAAYWLAR